MSSPHHGKLVITGDVHLVNYHPFDISGYPYGSWLQASVDALTRAVDIAKAGVLIFNGDVFENRKSLDCDILDALARVLLHAKEQDVKVIISAGNHDQVDKEGRISPLRILTDSNLCRLVLDEGEVFTLRGFEIAIHPYARDITKTQKWLKQIADLPSRCCTRVLCLHQDAVGGIRNGGSPSPWGISPADLNADEWNAVVFSHYHEPHVIKDWADNVMYVGSPRQNNTGEKANSPVFLSIDEMGTIEFHDTEAPRFLDVTFDQYIKLVEQKKDTDIYTVRCSGPEQAQKVVKRNTRIQFEPRKVVEQKGKNKDKGKGKKEHKGHTSTHERALAEHLRRTNLERLERKAFERLHSQS